MRHGTTRLVLFLFCLGGLAFGGDLEPPGPPAPTMKTLVDVEPRVAIRNDFNTLTPVVIDLPGSYYLAEDIFAFPGAHGIEITAGDVTLDLNGFSVIGNTEVGSLDGIHGRDQQNIVIKNGTVKFFFNDGIDLQNSPYSVVRNVHALSNGLATGLYTGIRVWTNSQIIDSISADGPWEGFHAESGSIIRGCIARDNGGTGIVALFAVIESNASFNNDVGISGWGAIIRGNVMASNTTNNLNNNGGGTALDNEMD